MPTYQYACTDCGHAFEQFQSFSDDALTVCPECSGKLRKLFNAVGVVFKGSGFYRTDSRGKNGAGEKPSEKPSEKSSEKPSETDAGRRLHQLLVLRLLVQLLVDADSCHHLTLAGEEVALATVTRPCGERSPGARRRTTGS